MAGSMPCKDCVSGTLHEGTPAGRVETIHSLATYVTDPPNGATPKGIIVIIPDAFGWTLVNSRILADRYAERGGFTVYLPDFMDGYIVDASLLDVMHTVTNPALPIYHKIIPGIRVVTKMIPFLYSTRQSLTLPRILSFFTALRTSTPLPIGTAGFCWGGKYVVLLCADTEKTASGASLIDAGYTAHPSNLVMPTDIENVKLPLCISNGTLDIQLKPNHMEKIKGIFEGKEKEFGEGKFEMNVIEGAKHGFAVRGNPGDEEEMKRGQLAEDQAVGFFGRWLVKGKA